MHSHLRFENPPALPHEVVVETLERALRNRSHEGEAWWARPLSGESRRPAGLPGERPVPVPCSLRPPDRAPGTVRPGVRTVEGPAGTDSYPLTLAWLREGVMNVMHEGYRRVVVVSAVPWEASPPCTVP